MHLLIDVRTSYPTDIAHIPYAESWALLWKKFHPDDTITWLGYEWDPILEGWIHIPRKWRLFQKKQLANHEYGPDRIVSFSRCLPIDKKVPTIQHISDIADLLYPRSNLGYIERKRKEYMYKSLLKSVKSIIVPNISTWLEISELFQVSEDKMAVIPYIVKNDTDPNDSTIVHRYNIQSKYFIAEWTPGNEWNPVELLQVFSQYIHDLKWDKKLVICGDMGENLSFISNLIRSLDIIDQVKILWILPKEDHRNLYASATGWIYVWPYYSGWSLIAEAESMHLPLILSDIPVLKVYQGTHIHPNHLYDLSEVLKNVDEKPIYQYEQTNDAILNVYTRILAD